MKVQYLAAQLLVASTDGNRRSYWVCALSRLHDTYLGRAQQTVLDLVANLAAFEDAARLFARDRSLVQCLVLLGVELLTGRIELDDTVCSEHVKQRLGGEVDA